MRLSQADGSVLKQRTAQVDNTANPLWNSRHFFHIDVEKGELDNTTMRCVTTPHSPSGGVAYARASEATLNDFARSTWRLNTRAVRGRVATGLSSRRERVVVHRIRYRWTSPMLAA
jgi:hypothetical protein